MIWFHNFESCCVKRSSTCILGLVRLVDFCCWGQVRRGLGFGALPIVPPVSLSSLPYDIIYHIYKIHKRTHVSTHFFLHLGAALLSQPLGLAGSSAPIQKHFNTQPPVVRRREAMVRHRPLGIAVIVWDRGVLHETSEIREYSLHLNTVSHLHLTLATSVSAK